METVTTQMLSMSGGSTTLSSLLETTTAKANPDEYVPYWVTWGVFTLGLALFVIIIVELYHTTKEVPVGKIEKWVNSIPFLRSILADPLSTCLTQDTDAPASSGDVTGNQEMVEHSTEPIGSVFTIDDGAKGGAEGGADGYGNPVMTNAPQSTEIGNPTLSVDNTSAL